MMNARSSRCGPLRRNAGFTLIELLVVVAIIALLISILLPSLSKAREQARSTLCSSRIGQLAKAILIYANDYDETPPFVGRGWEDCDDPRMGLEWPGGSGMTLLDWARLENWMMPNMPDYWMTEQASWPDQARLRNGSLFGYSRFEAIYRCPEFERITDSRKTQNVFNYTRSVLGRKWFHMGDPETKVGSIWVPNSEHVEWCGQAGPVLKISQIHVPSRLHMLLDERWDKHCAAPVDGFGVAGEGLFSGGTIRHQWMAIDCMFGPWGNEIGQYHGARMGSQILSDPYRSEIAAVKRGNAAFYDGHVELELDPLPDRRPPSGLGAVYAFTALLDWMSGHIFAQRGLSPNQIEFGNLF
jgi:prepilin-type N-terminal cleavage/methylation domain-containing protein/prepilin-type processing-associated H-X9-DG protein